MCRSGCNSAYRACQKAAPIACVATTLFALGTTLAVNSNARVDAPGPWESGNVQWF